MEPSKTKTNTKDKRRKDKMEIYAVKINGLDHPMALILNICFAHGKSETIKERNRLGQKIQVAKDEKMSEVIWEKEGGLNSLGTVIEFSMNRIHAIIFRLRYIVTWGKRVKVMSCILRQQSWKIRGRQSGLEYGGEDTHPEFRKKLFP